MTLFAALTAKDGETTEGITPSTSSSSPPQAIQLHSNRVIDFLSGSTVHLTSVGGDASKSSGEDGKGEDLTSDSRYFSALSYQAIQTQQDDGPVGGTSKSGTSAAAALRRHLRPDLGVWDCRVNGSNAEASAMLLKRVVVEKKESNSNSGEGKEASGGVAESSDKHHDNNNNNNHAPPILMAVDFSNPAEVQPVIEQLRSVILGIYDNGGDGEGVATSSGNPKSCTTTLKALEKSLFGRTLIQEDVTMKSGSSPNEQRLALILAVVVPSTIDSTTSSSAAEEYKERQARALLLYHLHKFALEVNCTLCFVSSESGASSGGDVSGDTGGGEEKKSDANAIIAENDPLLGRNTTMSVEELGKVVRRVAMGLSPVEQSNVVEDQPSNVEKKGEAPKEDGSKDEMSTNNDNDNDDSSPQRPPSILVPGSHDAELIHGAYLRNASCEGGWDASKDDLTVALPPRSASSANNKSAKEDKNNETMSGDEEWLSQLASSIGLSPDAAAASTASSGSGDTAHSPMRERMKKEKSMKKRPVRSTISRNKDSKPKDEKEVMNFFDNLLKK